VLYCTRNSLSADGSASARPAPAILHPDPSNVFGETHTKKQCTAVDDLPAKDPTPEEQEDDERAYWIAEIKYLERMGGRPPDTESVLPFLVVAF